jgi:hypothetical protein
VTEQENDVSRAIQGRNGVGRSPSPDGSHRAGDDAGNALVVSLLVLMVLTSLGVAYVAVTKSEKQIAGNSMRASQALYAAEAGLAEGLHRMAFPAESLNYIGPAGLPTAGWGRYIVIASGASLLDPGRSALLSDGLNNDGDGFTDEPNETYPEVLTRQTINADALIYPFVRVAYKTQGTQLVRFGDADQNPSTPPVENPTHGAPVLKLTASGRRGSAAKTLEAEAVRFPIINAAAPLWCGGQLGLNGNAFIVDGHDHYPTSPYDTIPGAPPVPAILTEGPASDVEMAANQADNITGEGGNGSVQQSPFTYDFNQIQTQLTGMADYSFTGPLNFGSSTPTYGTLANPKVTVVNGNLSVNGTWMGGGILFVNGNLAMGGGCQFQGIVVATGDVTITGGGPADVARILGAIIYQGTMVDNSTVNGSGRVWYSSQAINSALNVSRYTLSWWRER